MLGGDSHGSVPWSGRVRGCQGGQFKRLDIVFIEKTFGDRQLLRDQPS